MIAIVDRVFAGLPGIYTPKSRRSIGWLGSWLGGPAVDNALGYSAVFAAVNLISNSMKTLPVHVYRRTGKRSKTELPSHPARRLLAVAPNPETKPGVFIKYLEACKLLWGNGYAEIVRLPNDEPAALWPIHPSRVEVKRTDAGALFYRVHNANANPTDIPQRDMFHVMGFSVDGTVGLSVVGLARTDIAAGIAQDKHSWQFFANNAQANTVIMHPEDLDEKAEENLRNSWKDQYGADSDRYGVVVLDQGMKVESLGMPHQDAEFLSHRQFTAVQIARWFGVPPHKIGDLTKSTYGNREQSAIDYVTDTVVPETKDWEDEIQARLIATRETDVYPKFSVAGLLRGDHAARASFYQTMRNLGAYSANDIRAFEDQDPIPGEGGDAYIVQGQYMPLDAIAARGAEPSSNDSLTPNPDATRAEVRASVERLARVELARMRRKEIKAVRTAVKRTLQGDSDGWEGWLAQFYERHERETIEVAGPALRARLLLTGTDESDVDMEVARLVGQSTASSRGQLAAVARSAGSAGAARAVLARLVEWENSAEDN